MGLTNRFDSYAFTIAAGQSAPATGYDTGGGTTFAKIYIPGSWDSAFLSIYGSIDGNIYLPDTDGDGNLLLLAVKAGQNCVIPPSYVYGSRFIKLVSTDSTGNLVNQTANRVINVSLRPT